MLEYQDEVRARLDDADRQRSASGDAQQQIRSLRADLQEQTRLADDAAANARHRRCPVARSRSMPGVLSLPTCLEADAVQCAERAANALRLQCDAHKAAERVAHERAGQIESRLDELVAVNDELESRLRAAEKDAAALRDQLAGTRVFRTGRRVLIGTQPRPSDGRC